MNTVPETSVLFSSASEHPLWNVDMERSLIDDSLFATIYCSNDKCDFSERLFFRGKSDKCPRCNSRLSVGNTNNRNAVVGNKTENFALSVLEKVVQRLRTDLEKPLYAKRGVICPGLGFKGQSSADLAILNKDSNGSVSAGTIECLFEVKMSFIWNWNSESPSKPIADYDGHSGRPSIFRTDSILKAIGKAAITRSYRDSGNIPFVVISNTPPSLGYRENVDGTVNSGLIQKWVSLTPSPLVLSPKEAVEKRNPKQTSGFLRIDRPEELYFVLKTLLGRDWHYMSAMVEVERIGHLIKSLEMNRTPEEIGHQFLQGLPAASF